MRVRNVVKTKTSFDAQAAPVGGPVAPFDVQDLIVLNVVGELTADAAVGTYTVDPLVGWSLHDTV